MSVSPYIPFTTTVSYNGGGNELINGSVLKIINEMNLEIANFDELMARLDFMHVAVSTPTGESFNIMGGYELDNVPEGSVLPEQIAAKMPAKSFALNIIGGKRTTTYLMSQRFRTAKPNQGADSSVKAERADFNRKVRDLVQGAQRSKLFDMINVLYKGLLPVSAVNGAGSPTPTGKALFSSTHPYRAGTATFSNVLEDNPALTAISLQQAITTLKTQVRLENGYKVTTPKKYKLIVSPDLAVTARVILNTPGSQSGIYSGTGTNANQLNVFSFQGNMVELVEMPYFGVLDKNNQPVGLDTMRFLTNPEVLTMQQAFRCNYLEGVVVDSYEVQDTKNFVVAVRDTFQCDHYNAQIGIVGSLGDGSATQA
jgi:hypothetical protein